MHIKIEHLLFKRSHVIPLTQLKGHITYIGKKVLRKEAFFDHNHNQTTKDHFVKLLNNLPSKGNDCGYRMIIHFNKEVLGHDEDVLKEVIRMSMNDLEELMGQSLDWLGINHFSADDRLPHTHLIISGYNRESKVRVNLNSYHFLQLEKGLISYLSKAVKI
ncbi:hypothetical protein [Alkalicoccobacillus gibsonii]|jgi:hypothetical protein|uniref:hypothetical protein n=1 Tax=Alkalicoccobacillus gibsonii TaxID=79881 RepID=UPI001931C9BF|nr:hypothetical protein [Alkalicoccobacillus gibsonii]MBM0066825.1 hypothetical protein [Alkalicoccobacillus gibsonii]